MRVLFLAGLLALCAAAQTPSEPPALIRIVRSRFSAGHMDSLIQPYARAKAAVTVLGMSVVAGPPEAWVIETHDDFGSVEDLDKALGTAALAGIADLPDDKAWLGSATAVIARYRAAWSYRPEQAIGALPRARYLNATMYHAGSTANALADIMRQRRQRAERANVDLPGMTYEVVAGTLSGTCIILTPLASLRAIDNALTRLPGATGESAPASGATHENLLFRLEPGMSLVSDSFSSADPDFWRGKAGPAY
ncbi:MAG: hypothetical protein ABSH47_07055 [Bryobacteraceae bacterium]|jgi:hypothetical protein